MPRIWFEQRMVEVLSELEADEFIRLQVIEALRRFDTHLANG